MTRHHRPHEVLYTGKPDTEPARRPRRALKQNLHACVAWPLATLTRCARTAAVGNAGTRTDPGRRR